jgi:uncharacterized protein (DUF2147 family)
MLFSEDIMGFWKSISDETQKPQSIIAIYPYKDKYYGRLIATYDDNGKIADTIEYPHEKAPAIKGNPYYAGLDIIWDLEKEKDGAKYINGVILDPQKGDEYAAKAWIENDNLIVRGEILFIGKNQTWPKAQDSDFPVGFKKPDLTKLIPVIPVAIDSEEDFEEEE